jgi:hypothetical protein
MTLKRLFTISVSIICVVSAGCVTYTPITAPPLMNVAATKPNQPTPRPCQTPTHEAIPVPPAIPATVHLSIVPGQEPTADEGGWQLVYEYANAQKAIKDHNKKLEQPNR